MPPSRPSRNDASWRHGRRLIRSILRPLPLSVYAISFVAITLVLFAVLGGLTLRQLDETRVEVQRVQLRSAEQEFLAGIEKVESLAMNTGRALAAWDEVRQQLADSTYYAYWRGYRLMRSDLLPDHVLAAELYGTNGRSLSVSPESPLPAEIHPGDSAIFAQAEDGRVYLYHFSPVEEPGDASRAAGYVGLKLDFLAALLALNRFHYLDESTVTFTGGLTGSLEPEKLGAYFTYALLPNPEAQSVQNVMEAAVVRLSLMVGSIAVGFYLVLAFLLAVPLRRLSRDIDRMGSTGDAAELTASKRLIPILELEKVRRSLLDYHQQLKQVHQSLDEKNRSLWQLAHHDALTSCFNRRAFDVDWMQLSKLLQGQRIDVAFLLFDCDHFKAINDTYGHQVGDQIIQVLAQRIREGLRHGDRLYRLGGDEFATVLLNCSREDAQKVAERCVDLVLKHDFSSLDIREPIRLSVGIAMAGAMGEQEINALHWQADVAMYRAKRPGSNHIQFYSESLQDGADALVSSRVASVVYDAIQKGTGVEMHYQPIVKLGSGETEYYEALVRLRHEGELLTPGAFLPLIEARRLEFDFDLAILEAIERDLKAGILPQGSGVSINLSGQSVTHARINEYLAPFAAFREQYRLILEVTETALIRQLGMATENLDRARAFGFSVALDDFGSGYSSLRYLGNMPVDIVKFDITIIRQLGEGGKQRHMVEQLAAMIAGAGYRMVAEGIETIALRDLVMGAGFDYGQGYLFGTPGRTLQSGHDGNRTPARTRH